MINAGELFSEQANSGMLFGTVIHQLFEHIGWLDEEGAPSAEQLHSWIAHEDPSMVNPAINSCQNFLNSEAVQYLHRNGASELWRERPFLINLDGRTTHGSFDRVHIWRDDSGQPVRAQIIDFKSDRAANEAALSAHAEHYRPQLQAYREALGQLLGMNTDKIETGLLFLGEQCYRKVH